MFMQCEVVTLSRDNEICRVSAGGGGVSVRRGGASARRGGACMKVNAPVLLTETISNNKDSV